MQAFLSLNTKVYSEPKTATPSRKRFLKISSFSFLKRVNFQKCCLIYSLPIIGCLSEKKRKKYVGCEMFTLPVHIYPQSVPQGLSYPH